MEQIEFGAPTKNAVELATFLNTVRGFCTGRGTDFGKVEIEASMPFDEACSYATLIRTADDTYLLRLSST